MNGARPKAALTLGPVLFHWNPERWRDFYFKIADEADIDSVCVGEVVCAKRLPSYEKYIAPVAERLSRAGKEVVLSSLALALSARESAAIAALAEDDASGYPIEINDMFAAARLKGRPHMVGPFVNCYNEGTLAFLARMGAVRVALPAELPAAAIAPLAGAGLAEIEIQAFGRMPLALSARCYHARSRGLSKDGCQYVCAEDPDGMDVETMDGVPFLAVNGIQTMSFRYANLLRELDPLRALGVTRFRLWPQGCDMVAVAALFRAVLNGTLDPETASARLADLAPEAEFANGYVHGRAGHAQVTETDGTAFPLSWS